MDDAVEWRVRGLEESDAATTAVTGQTRPMKRSESACEGRRQMAMS